MTSDAKIGLLLGLIFIFVIAFIINGLPNLRPQPSKGDVNTNMASVKDENLGLADREQKARETMAWSQLIGDQTEPPTGPVATAQSAQPVANGQQPVAAESAKEGARSIVPSTDNIEKLTKGLEDIVKIVSHASESAGAQGKTTEPAPTVDVARSQPKTEPKPDKTQATETAGTTKPTAPAPAGTGKTYLVVDGDNLATIAKKVYGPDEGNRIVNNLRIFEANRNLLKSADDIAVGQELVIPPPAKPVEKKPDTVLPKTLFEKVNAIGMRHVPAPEKTEATKATAAKTELQKPAAPKTEPQKPAAPKTEPAKPATTERWYTVQDGDYLWKIASAQLGSGVRYEELAKLNADILKGDIKVSPGMRLRLPSK